MKPLKGKVALVTGGTRGIGAAIADRLKSDGARVIITGARSSSKVHRGFKKLKVDFSDRTAVEGFVEEAGKLRVDILINNAGINKIAPFSKVAAKDFDAIMDVNVRSAFLLTQAVLPHMRRKKWGRIVNITSIFGSISKEHRAPYSTSKFGLDGMTAALAAEVAKDGILTNSVAPGFVDTDLTRRVLGKKGMAKMAATVPVRRLAKPKEIAAFVAWVAGKENTYISGQQLLIDGGFSRV